MSENRFKKGDWTNCRYNICEIIDEDDEVVCIVSLNDADKVIAILEENEQLITERNLLLQKKDRYYRLYELKDAEVTARVDTLNKVCNYYLTEAQFKAGTDPNEAVKEVINEILNTEVEM